MESLTSWYRSIHRLRHFWSLLLRLLPGLLRQALKHLSRTVCKGESGSESSSEGDDVPAINTSARCSADQLPSHLIKLLDHLYLKLRPDLCHAKAHTRQFRGAFACRGCTSSLSR